MSNRLKTLEIDLDQVWQINCSMSVIANQGAGLMRKVLLIGLFVLLISPMGALADTVSFGSNTSSSSSWTLSGSPSPVFDLSSLLTSTQLNSGSLNTAIADGTIGWTTAGGAAFGSNVVIFNPGGEVTVTGDLGAGIVTLFTGSFQDASLTLVTGGAPGQSTFSASFIAGAINPALYSFLGAGALSPNVTGTLSATLIGTFSSASGGSGSVAGATVSLDPPAAVPEPGMLTLFGTGGLLALAGLRRRKLVSQC
jgi:PEP-CTERM motif